VFAKLGVTSRKGLGSAHRKLDRHTVLPNYFALKNSVE
jgi:hypothetical protein